ncbi:MAG: type VI secretion system ATPase TssH [Myxococcales bacterium]|nr:type VI secretion system ATPase TssH [Myxococcales bacterium]
MLVVEPRPLLRKLNPTCTRALEAAAAMCMQSRHYEVTTEHVMLALLDDRGSDVTTVLEALGLDLTTARSAISRALGDLRSGNAGKPAFSPLLLEWIQDAWLYGSTELGEAKVRSGGLLVRLAAAPTRYTATEVPVFEQLPREELRKNLAVIAASSGEAKEQTTISETGASTGGGGGAGPEGLKGATALGPPDGALARFTSDLTERARKGELDPVFGREPEIRQLVDILSRRRKNNPVIVGEPGVGKTALVEGLALRIAEGSVPEQMRGVHLLVLDLGALQAGAGVKGEFENRLKGVIAEVKSSPKPIVVFIDEAHTIIGAGGQQGGGDAANLLKPALARGELRTIAATTWTEYKKYFEKDAALERRFQPVKVDEPSLDNATLMLRGLAKRFEEAHGIIVQDEAVRAAVSLSSRYISGRLLPDKAVDLLDTSAARVKVLRGAPPSALEDRKAELAAIHRHLEALERDERAGLVIDQEARKDALERKAAAEGSIAELEARTAAQRAIVERVDGLRKEVTEGAEAKRPDLRKALDELKAIKPEDLLVHADVDPEIVAAVVGDWTGIPVGKMVKDDIAAILDIEPRLRARVRGQDHALDLVAREIRAARSGLKSETQPIGVFLLVGPSGVGKTETALALADILFGGERFMCTINMSEFQERHTVSRLIGSPPGYVGFGEGGMLTEAVRQRPYSLVLLDEVEKADRDVLNLFYQVFDKGMLADGEGRVIDFKNTVLILTSNLATDLITNAADPAGDAPPSLDDMVTLIKPTLSAHFKPALLARMTVVPYYPIRADALAAIVRMKLKSVANRARASHGIDLQIDDAVVDAIAARCREVESGARNADHILRGSVLPILSAEILRRLADGSALDKIRLALDAQGNIVTT